MDWMDYYHTNYVPVFCPFSLNLTHNGLYPVSLLCYFIWRLISSLIPLPEKLNVYTVSVSSIFTHTLFIPSGLIKYASYLLFSYSFFLDLIYMHLIHASVVSYSCSIPLISTLLLDVIICLAV